MKDIRFRQALLARHQARLPAGRNPVPSSSGLVPSGTLISRRRFIQGTGAVVTAATFARPQTLFAAANDPVPVTGSPNFVPFSVWAPLVFDPIDADPSTITNFNGVAGIAYISGMVTRTNTKTGDVERFPFLDADMRFMQGTYRGVDDRPRQSTFGFI
jgi:hypothetical protein